jgi:toxin-antitoxin system PIN domain toxin
VKGYLLDVNVLIALAWPHHVSHSQAHRWFEENASAGWATCPMTQIAFVRISSNPGIISSAVTPRVAHELLSDMMRHPAHQVWADDVSLDAYSPELAASMVGHRQVTDAYLLRLSLAHGGRLATFDRGILSLLPAGSTLRETIVLLDS